MVDLLQSFKHGENKIRVFIYEKLLYVKQYSENLIFIYIRVQCN